MAQGSSAAAAVGGDTGFRRRRPIDLVHLAKQTMGNRELELEILKMFEAQIRGQMQRLSSSADSAERRLLLHTMKGSAFGVGARSIGELAQLGEGQEAAQGGVGEELIADLQVAVEEAGAFISALLED